MSEPTLSGLQILGALFVLAWLLIAVALLIDKRWPIGILSDAEVADDRLLDDLGSATPELVVDQDDDLNRMLLGWRDSLEGPVTMSEVLDGPGEPR